MCGAWAKYGDVLGESFGRPGGVSMVVGGGWWGRGTSVVFYAHGYAGIDVGGRYLDGLLCVHEDV